MSAPTADREGTGVFSSRRARSRSARCAPTSGGSTRRIIDLGFAAFLINSTVLAFLTEQRLRSPIQLPDAVLLPVHEQGMPPRSQPLLAADHPRRVVASVRGVVAAFLLLFRLTCYYYRGAYYRSVWQSPTSCAVAEPHAKYTGETRFPLSSRTRTATSLHRRDHFGHQHLRRDRRVPLPRGFGFGLGNIILVVNVVLLWVYTLSCHPAVTSSQVVSSISPNIRCGTGSGHKSAREHADKPYAWITLGTLMLTDFYIMLLASGTISDLRFIG